MEALDAIARQVTPLFAAYMPYSFPGYFGILSVAALAKRSNPQIKVGENLQFVHNVFLSAQSLGLMVVCAMLYMDTAALAQKHPFWDFFGILTAAPERITSKYFEFTLFCFLISKLYETLDTVVLILNGKPLLLLHVWHHATTFLAFYTGLFTGGGFWIGMLNSFIHVIMYLYYARVPGMKVLAKYITSLQIFHLFGGMIMNICTTLYPMDFKSLGAAALKPWDLATSTTDCAFYSKINCFLCFSYFFLFLAFFSKKYHKKGSIWSLCGASKSTQASVSSMQEAWCGGAVGTYLATQGLLIPKAD